MISFVLPGRLLDNHFVDGAAEAPNVRKPVMTGLLDHFGCHPVRSPAEALRHAFIRLDDFL